MRRDGLVEARLVGHLRVARREIEQAALLAALRHDDPDAVLGPIGQPGLDDFGLGRVELDRQVDLRRRRMLGVELLQRGLKDLGFR